MPEKKYIRLEIIGVFSWAQPEKDPVEIAICNDGSSQDCVLVRTDVNGLAAVSHGMDDEITGWAWLDLTSTATMEDIFAGPVPEVFSGFKTNLDELKIDNSRTCNWEVASRSYLWMQEIYPGSSSLGCIIGNACELTEDIDESDFSYQELREILEQLRRERFPDQFDEDLRRSEINCCLEIIEEMKEGQNGPNY